MRQGVRHVDYDFLFKIILVGGDAVGKTCLLLRFCEDRFDEEYKPTAGLDFIYREMNIFGSKVKLQIWDSHPTTRFQTLIATFFRGAHGIIVLRDPSQPLASVKHWLHEIDRHAKESVCKLIVANSCDLVDNEQNDDGIKELAEGLGIGFMNISAKDSINCEECLVNLVWDILRTQAPLATARNIHSPVGQF